LECAEDKEALLIHGVTHILTLCNSRPRFPTEFEYMVLDLQDCEQQDIMQHFTKCFDFIDEGRQAGGILVHCLAGVSRSATIAIGYMMKTEGLTFDKAFDFVQQRHWCFPNKGFIQQLKQYEKQLASNKCKS